LLHRKITAFKCADKTKKKKINNQFILFFSIIIIIFYQAERESYLFEVEVYVQKIAIEFKCQLLLVGWLVSFRCCFASFSTRELY
jgi:hypothetical protein